MKVSGHLESKPASLGERWDVGVDGNSWQLVAVRNTSEKPCSRKMMPLRHNGFARRCACCSTASPSHLQMFTPNTRSGCVPQEYLQNTLQHIPFTFAFLTTPGVRIRLLDFIVLTLLKKLGELRASDPKSALWILLHHGILHMRNEVS